VDSGGAQVVDTAGLHLGDPQRGAVRGGHELDVPGEVPGLAGVPQVVALLRGSGDAVAGDQGAVQDHVAQALPAAAVQDLVQVGGAIGQDIDPLVQVAVAGGLRDARTAGQAVHAAGLAEPAQHEHGLGVREPGRMAIIPATDRRPERRPLTVTCGVTPRRPQVRPFGGRRVNPASSSKQM
jgi:hypothetical protein